MNKKISIFSLVSSHTLKIVLIICGILFLFQSAIFLSLVNASHSTIDSFSSFCDLFNNSLFKFSYILALLEIIHQCSLEYSVKNAKYMFFRFPKKTLFGVCFLNTLCSLLILWATQVIIILCAYLYYISIAPQDLLTSQMFFLSSFYSGFLHRILPSVDYRIWLISIAEIFLICSALSTITIKLLYTSVWKYLAIIIYVIVNFFYATTTSNILYFTVVYTFIALYLFIGGLSDEKIESKLQ
ncbi:MAG: hypothetical protein R3Y12_07085 [Clostridia bacterium]